jgi:anti-sigma factor RsiW
MTDHIGEDAALYALGMLETDERERIDAHVAACDACMRLLGQAEADVTSAVLAQPLVAAPVADLAQRRAAAQAPRWNVSMRAIAAVLILALLPIGYLYEQNRTMHDAVAMESDAMMRMASSPHAIVAFSGSDAKVIYAKDGSWYCVLMHDATAPVEVAWLHDGTKTMLGRVVQMPHSNVAMLYLPSSHRMDQLVLMSDGQIVAQAQLVF